jgi:glutathione S-transferase
MTVMSVAGVRYKVFNQEYVDKNLSAESDALKKITGKGLTKGCHPDCGLGRFSDKLSLQDWMELNIAQRCAGNYLEQITAIVTLLLLAGLFFPVPAAAIGGVYMVGRQLYSSGFKSKSGTGGRTTGFMIVISCHLALLGITLFSGLRMTGHLAQFGF